MRVLALLVAVIVVPFVSRAEIAVDPVDERWAFDFDGRKWIRGNSKQMGAQAIIEYVLPGETVTNWTELVTSQFASGADAFVADQWLALFTQSMSKKYTTFRWKRFPTSDGSILFEWHHQGGSEWPAQHEIKRVVKIKGAVYILAYVQKTKKLDEKTRNKWLAILGKAKPAQPKN